MCSTKGCKSGLFQPNALFEIVGTMAEKLEIPLINGGEPLSISMQPGQSLFVLGANGSGKSSLLSLFTRSLEAKALRISAHRQMWFDGDTINVSAVERSNVRTNVASYDRNPISRIRDPWGTQRPNVIIFDLMEAENARARAIAFAMDEGKEQLAKDLSRKLGPIKKINDLFRVANLPVQLKMDSSAQVLALRGDGTPFSVSRLSDGERNALIIAAEVLTAQQGTVLIIDEPERHLHRSISAPLLSGLFAERPDCIFVISSHDISLASEYSDSKMLLLRNCAYSEENVRWDANLLPPNENIDDQLRVEILGARKKVLFVEGEPQSLDKGLYSLIFPDVSVIAKGPSRNVQQAVSAIRASYSLHWLCPFGLIDNDNRNEQEIAELQSQFIYALPHHSVESIYYHTDVQFRVAQRAGALTGENATHLLSEARGAALDALRDHGQRLSERAILLKLRSQVMQQLPRSQDIQAGQLVAISIDTGAEVAAELSTFESLINGNNLEELMRRYPVRETAALGNIAKELGFQNRSQYESAVRKLLIDDPSALTFVRTMFGDLPGTIGST
jgi:ABC-type cobalamin/Fe3+-siderophores transport system ATPase subunit